MCQCKEGDIQAIRLKKNCMREDAQIVTGDFNRMHFEGDTERKKINFELCQNRTSYVIVTTKNV